MIRTVGSVCSGIEAASVAWSPLGFSFRWFSETAAFPSRVLEEKYPDTPNLGDMNDIPDLLLSKKIHAPDLVCGGTPCQAFSLAGKKTGLVDARGGLTLKFAEIIEANDIVRKEKGLPPCTVFWENVEGVLTDKTNAFGCLVSALAGLDAVLPRGRWPEAGLIRGPVRNVAWRVLDAKYFGLPQQRRRLCLLAGGKDFCPENVLFEWHTEEPGAFPSFPLAFNKDGHSFEIFRAYSDCLYASYGTKWNGNAAAYNGSLFVVQDGRIRRLSPLECERMMGFPDDYTGIHGARRTSRYQAVGNSWAVPVVRWIGERLIHGGNGPDLTQHRKALSGRMTVISDSAEFYDLGGGTVRVGGRREPETRKESRMSEAESETRKESRMSEAESETRKESRMSEAESETRKESRACCPALNCAAHPASCRFASLQDIISPDAPEAIYLSPAGCRGILRRKNERNISMNPRLEEILSRTAEGM